MLSNDRDLEALPPWRAFGFRPFFLLGALLATIWIPLWILILRGVIEEGVALSPVEWHSHEMIFGYAVAVISGFLLTAVRNWTKRPTAHGWPLVGLALLWLAARVLSIAGAGAPAWIFALVDLAFLPGLIVAVLRPIVAARSWRNIGFVIALAVMVACNLEFHLRATGLLDGALGPRATSAALDCVVLIMLIVGGRIIPGFTRNVVGKDRVRERSWVDPLGLWAAVGAAGLWAAAPGWAPSHAAMILAGLVNLGRAWGWGGAGTLRAPILWVLHLAWLCVSLGLVARGVAAETTVLTSSAATHLLTVGGVGVLTLGMMSRVALGHTGRALELRPAITLAFVMLTLAAIVRVATPSLAPGFYVHGLELAAALWTGAFVIYLLIYTPILLGPRADGRPG